MEPKYEEQFTAFVDFLGFSEASEETDDNTRLRVLELLRSLSALRGEFDMKSWVDGTATQYNYKPTVSTFSDHVVLSYPLDPLWWAADLNERMISLFVTAQFNRLLAQIASTALRIGFLIRGGATIGMLYHAEGVVFGEALIEAFEIESRVAVYPRVVLSRGITDRPLWTESQPYITRGADGLHQFDYFRELLFAAAPAGERFGQGVREQVARTAAFAVRVFSLTMMLREVERPSPDGSKLRRPFPRYSFITVRLLPRRPKSIEKKPRTPTAAVQSAGVDRHAVEDERALQARSSESPGLESWGAVAGLSSKGRQRL
jgi:hypothetical protein